jgi:hypothetical protein
MNSTNETGRRGGAIRVDFGWRRGRRVFGVLLVGWILALILAQTVRAQTPTLLWTNAGGRVFAVDAQTNVYAHM